LDRGQTRPILFGLLTQRLPWRVCLRTVPARQRAAGLAGNFFCSRLPAPLKLTVAGGDTNGGG